MNNNTKVFFHFFKRYVTFLSYVTESVHTLCQEQITRSKKDNSSYRKSGIVNKQTDRRTDGRTEGQTDRQADRQTDRETDRQIERQTERERERERERDDQYSTNHLPVSMYLYSFTCLQFC